MIEEIDLWNLVVEVDEELMQKGVEPHARPPYTYLMIARRLQRGSSAILQHDPILHAVQQIYAQLYRPEDLHMPPLHVGAFMFKDLFFPV